MIKKKYKKKNRSGILLLKNIHPSAGVIRVINFLKNFGEIKRTFFFNSSCFGEINSKPIRPYFACIVEFTKKTDAKRASILTEFFSCRSFLDVPFQKAFYLKKTYWDKLVGFLK
jgi:hypothetical protein